MVKFTRPLALQFFSLKNLNNIGSGKMIKLRLSLITFNESCESGKVSNNNHMEFTWMDVLFYRIFNN